MSTELSHALRRRAVVHHALGDPLRLAIVDALTIGDASPSQLRAELDIASNLLAHHIGVLEEAGVLRRVRSEGDRRRSYLTLIRGVIEGLNPRAGIDAPRIVFVCTENAARSQLAAALWAARGTVPATSAGTHPAARIHPGAITAARRAGLALASGRPRHVDEVIEPGDVMITVCDRAHEELGLAVHHRHWSVGDPARTDSRSRYQSGIDTSRPGEAVDRSFDAALGELAERIASVPNRIPPVPPTVPHEQPRPR